MKVDQKLLLSYEDARKKLLKIQGVGEVGFGLKEIDNILTETICYRVYVKEKKEHSELKEGDCIPLKVDGIQTDVIEIGCSTTLEACGDLGGHNEIKGGINILTLDSAIESQAQQLIIDYVNEEIEPIPGTTIALPIDKMVELYSDILDDEDKGAGTGGAVGELNNKERNNKVILTNNHVIGKSDVGIPVFHATNRETVDSNTGEKRLTITTKPDKIKQWNDLRLKLLRARNASPKIPDDIKRLESYLLDYTPSDFIGLRQIGKVHNQGMRGNFEGQYENHGNVKKDYYLDCAIAKIDTRISSCCKRNRGVKFSKKGEIAGFDNNGNNFVSGVRTLSCEDIGTTVYKVGATTGKTEGRIKDIFGLSGNAVSLSVLLPTAKNDITNEINNLLATQFNSEEAKQAVNQALADIEFNFQDSETNSVVKEQFRERLFCQVASLFIEISSVTKSVLLNHISAFLDEVSLAPTSIKVEKNIIFIEPVGTNCKGNIRFAESGDSGSVIVDEQNRVVGLLYAVNLGTGVGLACHIQPVLDFLNIKLLNSSPPTPASENAVLEDTEAFDRLENSFRTTVRGKEIEEVFLKHQDEVEQMINQVRPVTVTWHRSKGPAFLGHFLKSIQHPDYVVPQEIDGLGLKTSLGNMAKVLLEYGSPSLIDSIRKYEKEVLAIADRVQKAEDFIHLFNPSENV